MTADTWAAMARIVAIFTGIAIGSGMMSVACVVWVRKQMFGLGGSVLCGCGSFLLGLSIYNTFELDIGANKLTIKAAKDILQSSENVSKSADQAAKSATASAEIANKLAAGTNNAEIIEKAAKAATAATSANNSAKSAKDQLYKIQNVIKDEVWKF